MESKIKIITKQITLDEVKKIAKDSFGEMVKAVVDLEEKILALGGEMHADAEALLIANGSKQENLWGFNIYPNLQRSRCLEFSSFINIRPLANNRSMKIKSQAIRKQIKKIVDNLIR